MGWGFYYRGQGECGLREGAERGGRVGGCVCLSRGKGWGGMSLLGCGGASEYNPDYAVID